MEACFFRAWGSFPNHPGGRAEPGSEYGSLCKALHLSATIWQHQTAACTVRSSGPRREQPGRQGRSESPTANHHFSLVFSLPLPVPGPGTSGNWFRAHHQQQQQLYCYFCFCSDCHSFYAEHFTCTYTHKHFTCTIYWILKQTLEIGSFPFCR